MSLGAALQPSGCPLLRPLWVVRIAEFVTTAPATPPRDVLEGGEGGGGGGGVGWDPPPPRVPLWSPPKAGRNFSSVNPPSTLKAPKQNIGCQPQRLEGEEGPGGGTAVLIHPCPAPPPNRIAFTSPLHPTTHVMLKGGGGGGGAAGDRRRPRASR